MNTVIDEFTDILVRFYNSDCNEGRENIRKQYAECYNKLIKHFCTTKKVGKVEVRSVLEHEAKELFNKIRVELLNKLDREDEGLRSQYSRLWVSEHIASLINRLVRLY